MFFQIFQEYIQTTGTLKILLQKQIKLYHETDSEICKLQSDNSNNNSKKKEFLF